MNSLAKKLALLFALLAAFPSFSTAASAADEATKALKTYWAVRDGINSDMHRLQMQLSPQYAAIRDRISLVTTPGLAASLKYRPGALESFSREIALTKIESERRVSIVAVIRNVTPVPAGGVLNNFQAKLRNEGERYKYIVDRVGNEWRVAEIWEWDFDEWEKDEPDEVTPIIDASTFSGR